MFKMEKLYAILPSTFLNLINDEGSTFLNLINDEGFQNALYMIDMGQNDIADSFLKNLTYAQVIKRIPSIITEIKNVIKVSSILTIGGGVLIPRLLDGVILPDKVLHLFYFISTKKINKERKTNNSL
jgi:hypothetical protein